MGFLQNSGQIVDSQGFVLSHDSVLLPGLHVALDRHLHSTAHGTQPVLREALPFRQVNLLKLQRDDG